MSLQKGVKNKKRVLSCVVLDYSNLTLTFLRGVSLPWKILIASAIEMSEIRWHITDAFKFISM